MSSLTLHWRLDTVDGNYLLVEAPTFLTSRRILAHYQELKEATARGMEWLSTNQLKFSDASALDIAIYPYVERHYRAIATLVTPSFDPNRLMAHSRYRFFVATEPISHPDYSHPIPGLSGLEQMLGLSHPIKSKVESRATEVIITSGDFDVDLMADLLVSFPESAIQLANTYSAVYLSKLVVQASERRRGKEAIEERQREVDTQAFEKNDLAIADSFRKMGVAGVPF